MPSTPTSSLNLPPPDFSVDENDSDLELWTFRLPVNVKLSALDNVEFDMKQGSANFSSNGKDYQVVLGDSVENETFRVLLPRDESNEESEESDDESKESTDESAQYLQTSKQVFAKHFNVLSSVPELTESQVAPREGPAPADKMRHAYSHIDQRTGLKRRWMPIGVVSAEVKHKPTPAKSTTESVPSSKKRKAEEEDDSESSGDEKKLTKAERKLRRAEKRAKKEAKKEAKKAKKAAKKAKKVKEEA